MTKILKKSSSTPLPARRRSKAAVQSARDEKLEVRIARASKRKLQEAASITGRTVTDFVVQTALIEAEIALSGRTQFSLPAGQWERFLAALDAPARPMPRLKRLLREKSVAE